ncbi:hypothetical protein C882_2099 [Caenispirillum salinarum AK4]|uniref:Peptidase inhibitor I78 family protein n=1 Tax=Caenispirillum salinarum AK4 TaxID=1238182 RepID=K9GLI8_9PROT|nr:I78 family peptidase inhibitor [Caenispirillum salinarum]EKV26875.1 hypothetical protein C882_2099 [Caenispirillum salinarum AK4]
MLFRRRLPATATAAAAVLALAACAAGPQEPEPPLERPAKQVSAEELASCNASDLADALGKRLVRGEAGPEAVSVDALPDPHRVVMPGMAVTMDFRPDRLTITTTRDGIITKLTCG